MITLSNYCPKCGNPWDLGMGQLKSTSKWKALPHITVILCGQAFSLHNPWQLFFFSFFAFFSYFRFLRDGLKYLGLIGVLGLIVAVLGVIGLIKV
jgi:hypothetical protein